MTIFFVQDFFHGDYSPEYGRKIVGGAEAHDKVLIEALKRKFNVLCVRSKDLTHSLVKEHRDKVWFLSNFGCVDPAVRMKFIEYGVKYFIYEHDHKYVIGRNPIVFPNFIAPPQYVDNKEFLCGARTVYVNTDLSRTLMMKNLRVGPREINIFNVQGNFFDDETFNRIEELNASNIQRKTKGFILRSNQQAKSHEPSVNFCNERLIEYDLLDQCDYDEILIRLRSYSFIVYFTHCVDTFCRLIAEANMLNCRVITDPTNMGIYSERAVVKLRGSQMIDYLRTRRDDVIEHMIQEIEGV